MPRHFVKTVPARVSDVHDGSALTLVSYNILADKYATSGVHSYASDQQLPWSTRWPRILEELRSYDADVICLQEVERPVFERQLLPSLPAYEGLFYGRAVGPQDPVQGPEEGVALLTLRSRISVLAHELIRLADHLPDWAAGACRDAAAARQDGAVVALLRDSQLGRDFVAATAHLHWDPRWPDVKLLQAQILTARIGAFIQSHKPGTNPMPLLLAGDFNSLARKVVSDAFDEVPEGRALQSGVYELLTTGTVSWQHPDHPWERALWRGRQEPAWRKVEISSGLAPLHSAYRGADGSEPPLTTKTASFAGCIDYIWLGWGWVPTQLLELPYQARPGADAAEVSDVGPLPDDEFPSDHLALGARLVPPCDVFSL